MDEEKPVPVPTPCRKLRRAEKLLAARVRKFDETRKRVSNPHAYRKPGRMQLR